MDVQSTLGTVGQALKNAFKGMTDEMQACIQNCIQCHQVCENLVRYCLKKGGMHAEAQHIRLLQDCSQICSITADFMLRESPFHTRTCSVCAEICLACAEDCDRMGDDERMKNCAQICRQCADSCKRMAAH